MNQTQIKINNYGNLNLKHIVLDYNGTIAKDGILKEDVKKLLPSLSKIYTLHVITADTFGSVHKQVDGFDINVKVLTSENHTLEKAQYIDSLNSANCAAIGNGNNDIEMLQSAKLAIALVGDEGCATKTLLQSDIVCKNIKDALELFLNTKRLIATLRK